MKRKKKADRASVIETIVKKLGIEKGKIETYPPHGSSMPNKAHEICIVLRSTDFYHGEYKGKGEAEQTARSAGGL